MGANSQTLAATCVAIQGSGVLLLGKSGAGKSDLALRLIDRGAKLVADDQVILTHDNGKITLSSPPTINGLLEVRDLGIFRFREVSHAPLALVIQLSERGAVERLPHPDSYECLGNLIPQILLYPFDASSVIKTEMAVASLHDNSMMVGALKD